MSKKIVIVPVFCESHLIKYQISNIIDTIDPDYIIYNEGMFPSGPESTTNVNSDFIKKYTLDGVRGFDFLELEQIIKNSQKQYPEKNIILNKMDYSNLSDANECYYRACSNFDELGIQIQEGDYIFPFEGDVFHHENSKREISEYLTQLEPDTGFKSNWIDFVETQYFCEKASLKPFTINKPGRHRKVCLRYGTSKFYKEVLLNFISQKYPMLYPTDLITYHYAWWRPGKFKELRYAQLNRSLKYWQDFEKGLKEIKESKNQSKEIVLRPSFDPQLTHHWASFIDIEHPKHVKSHPNYIINK